MPTSPSIAIGIESPSFRPAPLQRLAEKTGGRYVGASGTKALQAIYAALAEELRRTWQLSYFTSAVPATVRASTRPARHAESIVPGARVVSKPAGSKLPDAVLRVGPAAIATIVGLCSLIAALFLLQAPAGRACAARLTPAPRRAGAQARARAGRGAVRHRLER